MFTDTFLKKELKGMEQEGGNFGDGKTIEKDRNRKRVQIEGDVSSLSKFS
jgi:hypothetical protein